MASYEQVTFDEEFIFESNTSFNECRFKKITFAKQNFDHNKFVLCTFTECIFENCSGTATFDNCISIDTIFRDSTFTDSEMIDCSLRDCSFILVKHMKLTNCELIAPIIEQSVLSMTSKTVSKTVSKKRNYESITPVKKEKNVKLSSARKCYTTCDNCGYNCREEKDVKNHKFVFRKLGLDCKQYANGCGACDFVPKYITTVSIIAHVIGCPNINRD